MSHFITLTHVYVDLSIRDEIDNAFRIKRELLCKDIEQKLQEKPDDFMLKFWLKEAQHPANEFERAVEAEIDEKLRPFPEQTEDPEYLEFTDMTEECHTRYEKDTVTAVRFSNGRIVSEYDNNFYKRFVIRDGLVYEKNWGQLKHEKRSKAAKSITVLPDYPVKKLYKDLDAFATENLGYR